MMKRLTTIAFMFVLAAPGLEAQAVPDDSQARRVPMGYRRSALFGVDPFRHAMIPKWGFVVSTGGIAANNALNLDDIGAITYLSSEDDLRVGDLIDALTLIPDGQGLLGSGQIEGSAYLGLSVAQRFNLGVTLAGRGYGSLAVDDNGVALLRDGNGARAEFSLGETQGTFLSTAELGVHSVFRAGPFTSPDGVNLAVGFGLRYVRPTVYWSALSVLDNGGRIVLTGDSAAANLAVQVLSTVPLEDSPTGSFWNDFTDRMFGRVGSGGIVGDLMVRAEWPTSGVALEGMIMNVGPPVNVGDVPRRVDTLDVATTQLDDVREQLDSLDFDVRDSVDVRVALPRIWRLNGSTWANRILQIDVGASGTFSGDIDLPVQVDLGTTWRLVRHLPLRAGVILGGRQGIGYAGGFAIESNNFLFQVSGQSLGGWFRSATGVGGRMDLGFFF